MTRKFSAEEVQLVVESAGFNLDEPLRGQLHPEPEPPAEAPSPERKLADALAEAQSQWYDGHA